MTAHRIPEFCTAILRLSPGDTHELNLATFVTFVPDLSSFSSIGTDLDADPSANTIFVFGTCPSFGNSFEIPSIRYSPSILPNNINHNRHNKKT